MSKLSNANISELKPKEHRGDDQVEEEICTNATNPRVTFLKAEEKSQEDIFNC